MQLPKRASAPGRRLRWTQLVQTSFFLRAVAQESGWEEKSTLQWRFRTPPAKSVPRAAAASHIWDKFNLNLQVSGCSAEGVTNWALRGGA